MFSDSSAVILNAKERVPAQVFLHYDVIENLMNRVILSLQQHGLTGITWVRDGSPDYASGAKLGLNIMKTKFTCGSSSCVVDFKEDKNNRMIIDVNGRSILSLEKAERFSIAHRKLLANKIMEVL